MVMLVPDHRYLISESGKKDGGLWYSMADTNNPISGKPAYISFKRGPKVTLPTTSNIPGKAIPLQVCAAEAKRLKDLAEAQKGAKPELPSTTTQGNPQTTVTTTEVLPEPTKPCLIRKLRAAPTTSHVPTPAPTASSSEIGVPRSPPPAAVMLAMKKSEEVLLAVKSTGHDVEGTIRLNNSAKDDHRLEAKGPIVPRQESEARSASTMPALLRKTAAALPKKCGECKGESIMWQFLRGRLQVRRTLTDWRFRTKTD